MLCMMYPVTLWIIVFGPRSVAAWLGLPADDVIDFALSLALSVGYVLLVRQLFRDIRTQWLSRALPKRVSKGSPRGLDDAWLDCPR
jgi:hypothetical protein